MAKLRKKVRHSIGFWKLEKKMGFSLKCWILPILYYWGFPKSRIKKLEFKTPVLELVRNTGTCSLVKLISSYSLKRV